MHNLAPDTCWRCEKDRNAWGDGTRKCTNCGASSEPGWQSSPLPTNDF